MSSRFRRLAFVVATLVVFAGGWLWVRDSSLVAIERVRIDGIGSASGSDGPLIRGALKSAAREMTTLNVDAGPLRAAVARFPVVRGIAIDAHPPHELRIRVDERIPVGVVDVAGRKTPVASDGTVLRGMTAADGLPPIPGRLSTRTRHVKGAALRAVMLYAAAPRTLRLRVTRVTTKGRIIVTLRDGPRLLFGDPQRLEAKWAAAARVLADPIAAGASYIDVGVPERPAVGGLPADRASQPARNPAPGATDGDPGSAVEPTETPADAGPGTAPQAPPDTQPAAANGGVTPG